MKRRFPEGSFPLALLVLCLLSFGLLIPLLGFYWDDWPMILTTRLQGLGAFWDFYRDERPLSAWTLYVTAPLLGSRPFAWHLFTLFVRWLATLAMWWTLRGVWPRQGRAVSWMTLLFAVYPAFTQQPVAVAFSQHWLTFGLFFLSLGAMVYASRRPRRYWPLTLLGAAAAGLHLFTMEYFAGLELLRPALLWIVLAAAYPERRARLRATLARWLPYLLVLAAMIVWRLFFFKVNGDPNRPELLYNLSSQPLGTLARLLQISLQDLIHNLAGVWYATVDPAAIDLSDRAVLLSIAIAAITAGLAIFYFFRQGAAPEAEAEQPGWVQQALGIGLLGALLGPLPVWLTDRQAIFGLYSGRFALAAMFGLGILLVGLLEWFTPRRLPKVLLVGLLLGSAAGFHLRNATTYYRAWLRQEDFYWQLAWRAPQLQPGTALLSNDELFLYVGRASTAMTLNLVYPQPAGDRVLDYWFLELPHDIGPKQVEKLPRGRPLTPQFRIYSFAASSLDSLVIYYKPGAGRCLWLLSPQDADNPDLPDLTRTALPVSNLSRISSQAPGGAYPPPEIFGPEPEHTWCYFYQKAELARQMGEWETAARLGDEADAQGYTPASPHEWLPFITAYAHTGRWDTALARAGQAYELDAAFAPSVCRVLKAAREQSPPADELSGQVDETLDTLGCGEATLEEAAGQAPFTLLAPDETGQPASSELTHLEIHPADEGTTFQVGQIYQVPGGDIRMTQSALTTGQPPMKAVQEVPLRDKTGYWLVLNSGRRALYWEEEDSSLTIVSDLTDEDTLRWAEALSGYTVEPPE